MPLRGADLVLLALGSSGRGEAVSNNALLVVHCDGPVDPGPVTRSLARFVDVCPWPAARLRRSWPWGKLHWAAGRQAGPAPPVTRRTVATPAAFHAAVEAEVNAAIDPRREPPVRFLILDGPPGPAGVDSALVMTWFHPLMDPRGAQNLLDHLGLLDEQAGDAPAGGTPPSFVATARPRSLRERGRLARQSVVHMRRLGQTSPVTPRPARSGPVRFRQASFVAGEPAGRERPSREIWWRLAVVGKALHEVGVRRGLADGPVLLPIAVDLRPKGEPGPTFGNMLAFHFARFASSDTADVPRLAAALREQMADAVREGLIEANEVAMTFLQHRPLWMIRRAMRGISSGEAFSFNCADVGELPAALARCFGRRVVNAYHVPAVPPRPGIGVFFNRAGGRNNLVVAWIDGVLDEDDVTRIIESVREEMGWRETR